MKDRHFELIVTLFLTMMSYAMALAAPPPENIQWSLPSANFIVDYVTQSTEDSTIPPY